MKKVFIEPKEIIYNDVEFEVIKNFLSTLNIDYRVEDITVKNPTIKLYQILNQLECRTSNCLKVLVNCQLDMTLATFVENYKSKDFLSIRNAGKSSLLDLKQVLLKNGYELH